MSGSRTLAASLSVALAVSGCAGAANPTTGTPPSGRPVAVASPGPTSAPTRPVPPSGAPSASAGAHGESRVAAGVSYNYQTLAQFIRDNSRAFAGVAGVAVVTVESVGALRWNTLDGTRPPEPALDADWSNTGANRYFIGRAYTVRLERVAWGKWTATGPKDVYWLGGGKLGADEDVNGSADLVPPPVVGDTAVVLTAPSIDSGPGVIGSTISFLFPLDATGRVQTMNPTEDITLADLGRHLP